MRQSWWHCEGLSGSAAIGTARKRHFSEFRGVTEPPVTNGHNARRFMCHAFDSELHVLVDLPGPRARLEGFVLERVSAARVSFRGVSHAHRSITTDRSLTSNANVMPVSTLTQHQHGEPDSPESVCGGTLVGGEDDDERACEPGRVKRVWITSNRAS